MKASLVAIIFFAAFIQGATAGNMDGKYEGRADGRLYLDISGLGVSMVTSIPKQCTGGIDGRGQKIDPHTMILKQNWTNGAETGICMIMMKFDESYSSVKVTGENCSFFHGVSCDFNGKLHRK